MFCDETKYGIAREERGVKINRALRDMRIRYCQIQSTGSKIPTKIANRDPMTNVGLVDSQTSNKLGNCDGLVPTGRPAHKFRDDEWRDDEKVAGNCHIQRTNAAAFDVIDEN